MARLYYELGLLKENKLIEVDRSRLVASYIGQTADKTREVIESALDGVLFIDEAYTLARSDDPMDFGRESIDTLLKFMEDYRERLAVIVAGYPHEMRGFLEANPGLSSRFNRTVMFDNYTSDELIEVLKNLCERNAFEISQTTLLRLCPIFDREIKAQRGKFGNARYVRNLFERVVEAQAHRLVLSTSDVNLGNSNFKELTGADIEEALGEPLPPLNTEDHLNPTAVLLELDKLVGMQNVKDQVKNLIDFISIQKKRELNGLKTPGAISNHLALIGNPGTGKTTVARLIARIYFSLGLLPTPRMLEIDRSGLVGRYVGETAIKTNKVIQDALGGVLFIDEAYSLVNERASGNSDDFGREAIDTLLKALEDYRDQLVVIIAGYPQPIERFLDANPGLRSRFNRYISFPDYTPDELVQIYETLCQHSDYVVAASAHTFLKQSIAHISKLGLAKDNGRFIRNFFERSIEAQAFRLANCGQGSVDSLQQINSEDLSKAVRAVLALTRNNIAG